MTEHTPSRPGRSALELAVDGAVLDEMADAGSDLRIVERRPLFAVLEYPRGRIARLLRLGRRRVALAVALDGTVKRTEL